jgi:hypothetical protein
VGLQTAEALLGLQHCGSGPSPPAIKRRHPDSGLALPAGLPQMSSAKPSVHRANEGNDSGIFRHGVSLLSGRIWQASTPASICQPDAIDDLLTELAREGARRMLAQVLSRCFRRHVEGRKARQTLLAFFDFPAEHWDHLRTSNPIESVFATVRHRTVRTKGALSAKTAKLMVFKPVNAAAKHSGD